MTALETNRIVKRVIDEVAGTIATNGIQELPHDERFSREGDDRFGGETSRGDERQRAG